MEKIKLILLFLIFFSASCEKQIEPKKPELPAFSSVAEINSYIWADYSPENLSKIYCEGLKEFAFGTAYALKDVDFRIMLKAELLNKSDGDFDVIFKDLKEKEVNGEKISKIISNGSKAHLSSEEKQSRIESFGKLFKQLQLSMPVNIEKWDPVNNIPLVAFLEQSDEGINNILTTVNKDGEIGKIDGNVTPDVPVLVINLNERSDINGNIHLRYKNSGANILASQDFEKPKLQTKYMDPYYVYPPYSISGQYINGYNLISWVYPAEEGYNDYIQIEREINGSWVLILETFANSGPDTYFDTYNIMPGYQYLYRLRTKRINPDYTEMYSDYSSTLIISAQIAGLPTPTNSNLIAYGPNEISFSWEYPTNLNISGFKIRARRIGQGDPQFDVATLPPGSRSYTDLAARMLGEKYQYSVVAYNGSTESGALEDIVYNPFRTYTEHLYLTKIYFYQITEFEYWYLGTPEVEVSLAHLPNPTATQPIMIYREEFISVQEEIIPRSYDYPQAEYGYNLDVLSGNWDSYFYHHVLSFNFIEYDAPNWFTGWKGLSFSTKIPIKIGKIDIQASSSIDLNFNIRNTCIDLGSTYMAYWFPEEYSTQIQDDIIVTFSTQQPNWSKK